MPDYFRGVLIVIGHYYIKCCAWLAIPSANKESLYSCCLTDNDGSSYGRCILIAGLLIHFPVSSGDE